MVVGGSDYDFRYGFRKKYIELNDMAKYSVINEILNNFNIKRKEMIMNFDASNRDDILNLASERVIPYSVKNVSKYILNERVLENLYIDKKKSR